MPAPIVFAASSYLANKPQGAVLVFLLIAAIVAVVSAVLAGAQRAFSLAALAVAVAAFAVAFMLNG